MLLNGWRSTSTDRPCYPPTRTGTLLLSFVPSPSWPEVLSPQQYASPSVVTPQLDTVPAATDWKVCPPETGIGALLLSNVPFPS